MKSKKRHHSSSDESEESKESLKSNSSSDSDSDDSSESEHRHKKKRKRAESSDSDSDSDDQKRSKKRKHKKKKKKHSKKKRRSDSADESQSVEEISSVSEGEISPKKKRKHKHKHKHSRRSRSSSASVIIEEEAPVERRLHSVVKERRGSPGDEHAQPERTYYPRDYHQSGPVENERDREVQRFYRGSSKERRYQEQYRYGQDRNERYQHDRYNNTGKYQEEDYRQKPYDEYRRHQRFEDHKPPAEDYHKRPREEYHPREEPRGPNRYNQYEDRRPRRQEYDNGRDFIRDRRGPPDADRYREREVPDKRDRETLRDDGFGSDRPRDARRERPPRPEHKPPAPPARHQSHQSRSRSPDGRYKGPERRRDDRERPPRDDRERPPRAEPRARPDDKPRERRTRFNNADDKEYSWGKAEASKEGETAPGDKEKPNFGLSGKLTADTNTVNGVVIKYSEPDDAKQPKRRWRFYPFKGDKALPILYIHRQSCFLIGRDKKVVDISLDHPSISKQHAALQYRATPFERSDGSQGRRVRPYVIDLDSANGTFVNNKKIEPRRYVELLERDVVKFGFSQREYVLLHENSKDDAQDDDNEAPAVTTADRVKQEKRVKQEAAEDGD